MRKIPGGASGKEPTCQYRRHNRHGFNHWTGKIPWRRAWRPTPIFFPGESQRQKSLASYSPWDSKELDRTERLLFHFSLSCIGEGNGNPLQYSSLENPRDGGAWWAPIYGVAQSRTGLKWLSSSSSSSRLNEVFWGIAKCGDKHWNRVQEFFFSSSLLNT